MPKITVEMQVERLPGLTSREDILELLERTTHLMFKDFVIPGSVKVTDITFGLYEEYNITKFGDGNES